MIRRFNQIFLRYLLIFFLFSALLFTVFIPVYSFFFNQALERELEAVRDRLERGVAALDATIGTINQTAILVSGDRRFRIFQTDSSDMAKNPILLNELQRHFNGLLLSSQLIADAGIVYSSGVILTRQSIYYFPAYYPFYGTYLWCENLPGDRWFSMVAPTGSLTPVLPYTSMIYGSYEGFTWSVQWNISEGQEQNLLYVTLPAGKVLELLADAEILSNGAVRIYDSSRITLYEFSGEKRNTQTPSYILTARSKTMPIFFEAAVSKQVINGRMVPVIKLMAVFAVITFFSSTILSLIFAYKWSEPMRHLLAGIESTTIFKKEYEQHTSNKKIKLRNYFRRIYTDLSSSISVVDNRLEDSLKTIENQSSFLRVQIFDKALRNGIYSDRDRELFYSLFKDFPAFFQIVLIRYDSPPGSSFQKWVTLQLQMTGIIKGQFENIFVHTTEENSVILLLPLEKPDEYWYQKMLDLRELLNQQIELPLRFSLSGAYEKPEDLHRAWQEVEAIHRAMGIENLASIGQPQDNSGRTHGIPLTMNMLQMMYNALGNGNADIACNILTNAAGDFSGEKEPVVSDIIFDLLNDMLLLLKTEHQAVLTNEEIPRRVPGRERELFTKQFPECFHRIAEKIRQDREADIIRFGIKIMDFINENLFNPELYSVMVMDHFNISQPTLQKFVKQISGHTFLTYVETQRLKKAAELLSAGGRTIQTVSEQCGFSNVNSFYKSFKRHYGFPPSAVSDKNGEGHPIG